MSTNANSENISILKAPPEIFPLVASHLPLRYLPATVSALALTCKSIHLYVHPVLYTTVILRNENHASQVLERIRNSPPLGRLVRALHIRVDLHVEIHNKGEKAVFLVILQEVINKGFLPHMTYFGLSVLRFPFPDNIVERNLNAEYCVPRSFWGTLRRCCPLLRGVFIHGVGDTLKEPWVDELDFYELEDFLGLNTVALKYHQGFPADACSERFSQNLVKLASTLHSLTLFFNGTKLQDATLLFSLTFPYLKSLRISGIDMDDTTTVHTMKFWKRHPNLELVNIRLICDEPWFSDNVKLGLLPRLTHFMARFRDIRALATHLAQLDHLSINRSHNCQVLYLLRSVIPGGLPKLKSLEIHQVAWDDQHIRSMEGLGAMWYETKNGDFRQEKSLKKACKRVDGSYIHSIVKGAPNLEELCLHGSPLYMDKLKEISPILGRLKSLQRFYYRAFNHDKKTIEQADVEDFMQKCRLLGDSCHSLETVTDVSAVSEFGPYLRGNIIRSHGGSVEEVTTTYCFGMEFTGGHDDPFPRNRPTSF